MGVSTSRTVAFDVLRRVEAENAYASDLLHAELNARIKVADAALATELVMGVLRWRRLLDFLLERQTKQQVERMDLPVAIALRLGAYQLRFLDKIPPRAAVNESVELVKRARKSSAASLVNAVLRKIAAVTEGSGKVAAAWRLNRRAARHPLLAPHMDGGALAGALWRTVDHRTAGSG